MKHRGLRSISLKNFSVDSGDTATTRDRGTRETPNCRLLSGSHHRESLPRDLTTQATPKFLLLSPDTTLRHTLNASPPQYLSFPHLLDVVNHPVLPQSPVELVSSTRGEDASSSFLPAPLQKLCLPPIHTSYQFSQLSPFFPSYLYMSGLIHLSL